MSDDTLRSTCESPMPKHFVKRFSTVTKMAAIAVLVLLLLIPLAMVQSVLRERLNRRDEAVREITSTWGREQVVIGPILMIPYKYNQRIWKEQVLNGRIERVETMESAQRRAYFLPSVFSADGTLKPDRLNRGIYETVVYSGALNLRGSFDRPSFEEWRVDPEMILWDEAEIALSITDLRGAKESLKIRLADQTIQLMPGRKMEGFENGIYAKIKNLNGQMDSIPFEISLTLNGSRSLRFAPVGVNNDVQLSSNWPAPSFQGAFLPAAREVGPKGFRAHWKVSYYGRSYPQQWTDKTTINAGSVASSLFGVDLVPALDSYRSVERAIKYGVLLIALLFTAFFLFEILSAVRIHPFQYTLVGIALCLFYLGLLALSEVTSFGAAYWTGAAVSVAMIALYSARVMQSKARACIVAAGLGLVYAFLYVILRLQDYSLLVGTAGLFAVLALVMYVTRNIDWYARDSE